MVRNDYWFLIYENTKRFVLLKSNNLSKHQNMPWKSQRQVIGLVKLTGLTELNCSKCFCRIYPRQFILGRNDF